MKTALSVFALAWTVLPTSRFSSSTSHSHERWLITIIAIVFLTFPAPSRAISFGSVVDDVSEAVKGGANAIEDNVKKVFPGEDKNKKNQKEETTSKQNSETSAPTTKAKKETASNTSATTSATTKPKGGSSVFTEGSDKSTSTTPPPQPTTAKKVTPGAETAPAEVPQPAISNTAATGPKTAGGGTVFSKDPINPAAPPPSSPSFAAGDKIYGMLKAKKSWKELLGSSDYLIVYVSIDGKQKVSKTIGLKRPDLLALNYFIIDIAPDPSSMTNYSDRDIIFPEKDGYKFGPELFTKYLSELPPGKHTFSIEVKAYGDIYASGEFSISGNDYSSYATLLADIKNSAGKQQKMPKPGMTDIALQNEMVILLKNAGWPEVRRLVIVDKDWWIDRVSGGDSPVQSQC